jgi:hypothetical protein
MSTPQEQPETGSAQPQVHIQQSATDNTGHIFGHVGQVTIVYQSADVTAADPSIAGDITPREIGPNPYKGLLAFRAEESEFFFGRDGEAQGLWDRLNELHRTPTATRLLPVYGPSGSGKSSLVRAGLLPKLGRQLLPGQDRARVGVLVPGTRPLQALATVLARIATHDAIPVAKIREFTAELEPFNKNEEFDGLQRIASALPEIGSFPLIILIDQFEEVYSLCDDAAERDAFIANLLYAARDKSQYVSVILTLRSDFLGETHKHPDLNRLFSSQGFLVPTMNEDCLREAISKPAELAGYALDAATVQLLVGQTIGREGALPLLQTALESIWANLPDTPPAKTLENIRGVGGALAEKAQRVYNGLNPTEQEMARRLFLGLVQLGEGTRDTRRRALVKTLMAHSDDPEQFRQVIGRFTRSDVRLITVLAEGTEEMAEVTHEALFDHWEQLKDWLNGSRDDIRFQRRLEEAAQHWESQQRPEGLLWRPPDLNLLRDYQERSASDMTSLQVDFWQSSIHADQRRQRVRQWVTGGLAAGLVLTSLSTGIAVWNAQKANRNELKASRQTVLALTETARALNASGQEFDALIPLLRAGKQVRDNSLSEPTLLNHVKGQFFSVLLQQIREVNRFEGHEREVLAVAFSPDGSTIVTGSGDGTARLWQADGTFLAPLEGHEDAVLAVAFSPDGSTIVTGSRDGTARLWPWRLDAHITHACNQMGGYLKSGPNVDPEDRDLCD